MKIVRGQIAGADYFPGVVNGGPFCAGREKRGRMGNVNEYFYRIAAKQVKNGTVGKYLHTEIPGFNGLIQSNISPTYNASTGIGTPIVKELVGVGGAKSAGTPQTSSNP